MFLMKERGILMFSTFIYGHYWLHFDELKKARLHKGLPSENTVKISINFRKMDPLTNGWINWLNVKQKKVALDMH